MSFTADAGTRGARVYVEDIAIAIRVGLMMNRVEKRTLKEIEGDQRLLNIIVDNETRVHYNPHRDHPA